MLGSSLTSLPWCVFAAFVPAALSLYLSFLAFCMCLHVIFMVLKKTKMIEGLSFTELVDIHGLLDLNLSDKALKPYFPLKLCPHPPPPSRKTLVT